MQVPLLNCYAAARPFKLLFLKKRTSAVASIASHLRHFPPRLQVMLRWLIYLAIHLAITSVAFATIGSVVPGTNKGDLVFKTGVWDTTAIAWGNYSDWIEHKSGFGVLNIKTKARDSNGAVYDDTLQMKAAGFLEGMLTLPRIKNHHKNMRSWMMGELGLNQSAEFPTVFKDFMADQDKWMRSQIATHAADRSADSSTWWQVGLILSQFDGLVQATEASGINEFEMQMLNGLGDFFDLLPALMPSRAPLGRWKDMQPADLMDKVTETSRCSGLIKVTADLSEIYAGHSTFFIYPQMLRIYKHYHFELTGDADGADADPPANMATSFSSYPGLISSIDDFYLMQDTQLVMVQTTNSVFDASLYKLVTPQSLLAWHRVRTACQIAENGADWSAVIDFHNSGTYNNQYMVIDYKLFEQGKRELATGEGTRALKPGVLWVSEQIPGLVKYADVTQELERGYWPSYNVPYFEEVYNKSGYPQVLHHFAQMANENTNSSSVAAADAIATLSGLKYQTAPRANIFRRDQASVVDMASFQALLRSNDYSSDPLAGGDADKAICIRGDLSSRHSDGGCLDTKVTMGSWVKDGKTAAVNGPTLGGTGAFLKPGAKALPPFTWDSVPAAGAHAGLPDKWEFEFEEMQPAAWL
jgi:hypothetical protein